MSGEKTYTLSEFVKQAQQDLADYEKDWSFSPNEFHLDKHTFTEWYRSFNGYFSWEDR